MRSNTTRIALAVGAIAAIVVLFVVLNGGSDSNDKSTSSTKPSNGSATSTTTPKEAPPAIINVRGGKPAGGIQKLNYTKGDRIRFQVNSDVGDEIHVHGYDLHKDVKPGGSVSFSFPASIEGVFVVELEAKGEQIAELRVKPA